MVFPDQLDEHYPRLNFAPFGSGYNDEIGGIDALAVLTRGRFDAEAEAGSRPGYE